MASKNQKDRLEIRPVHWERRIRAVGDELTREEQPRTTWEGAQKSWAPARPTKTPNRESRLIRSIIYVQANK